MSSPSSYSRKQRRHEHEQRALARRISRQLSHDERHRPPSPITLPRLSCLEDCAPPDVGANASRPR
jgi:hypothetical protein